MSAPHGEDVQYALCVIRLGQNWSKLYIPLVNFSSYI